ARMPARLTEGGHPVAGGEDAVARLDRPPRSKSDRDGGGPVPVLDDLVLDEAQAVGDGTGENRMGQAERIGLGRSGGEDRPAPIDCELRRKPWSIEIDAGEAGPLAQLVLGLKMDGRGPLPGKIERLTRPKPAGDSPTGDE